LSPETPEIRSAVVAATVTAIAMIAYQVAAKATRDAFFLSTFHVTALPAMMIATSVLAIVLAYAFTRALNAWGPGRVIPATFAGSAALLLVEWAISFPFRRPAAILVYLHYGCLGALVISGFYSFLSERFDPRTAKRLLARVTGAGALGGVLGGVVASQVGRGLPVTTMIPILAIFHLICAAAVLRLRPVASPARTPAAPAPPPAKPQRAPFHLVAESAYLRGLIVLVLIVTLSEGLIDLVLKGRAYQEFGQGGDLLQFFAAFYTGVSILTVVAQATVGRFALEKLGPARTAALLPATTAAASAGALVAPGLGSAVFARGIESILANSVYRAGYEVLFTPVPAREKRSVKAIADVGASRAGDFLAAAIAQVVVMLAVSRALQILAACAAICSVAGAWIAYRLHAGYAQSLARGLVSRAVQLDLSDVRDSTTRSTVLKTLGPLALSQILRASEGVGTSTPRPSDSMSGPGEETSTGVTAIEEESDLARIRGLHSRDPGRVITALEAGPLTAPLVPHVVPLLAWDDVARKAIDALRQAGPVGVEHLVERLLDPNEDFTIRRRIPLVLATYRDRGAMEGLIAALADRRFEVRYRAGRALAHLAEMDPSLAMSREAAFQAVLREVQSGAGVWESRSLLDRMDDEAWSPVMDEFVRDRANRSLEHVFTLLALALPRQPLRIAFRGLHTDDPLLRGTALEYLESALPPEIRRPLWPYLEDNRPKRPGATPPAPEALRALLQSSESIVLRLEDLKRMHETKEEDRSS
jgi:ATP:ADP antiporter, AAA family